MGTTTYTATSHHPRWRGPVCERQRGGWLAAETARTYARSVPAGEPARDPHEPPPANPLGGLAGAARDPHRQDSYDADREDPRGLLREGPRDSDLKAALDSDRADALAPTEAHSSSGSSTTLNARSAASEQAGQVGADADGGLRSLVAQVGAAVRRVEAEVEDANGGAVAALIELLAALDRGQATAVALADRIQRDGLAERTHGLPLEGVLALTGTATFSDRRALVRVAEELRGLPNVHGAWRAGVIGWSQVRAITAEARSLDAAGREELDAGFVDLDHFQGSDPDQILDAVRDTAGRLRPDRQKERELRRIEHRFVHCQPALDGALTGVFELDPEGGASFLEALDAASPPPSAGPRDATRDALAATPDEGAHTSDGDDLHAPGGPSAQQADSTPPDTRTRARQRADGLVALAESFLAGNAADGTPRRPRPRMLVWADIQTLTGPSADAEAARLMWRTVGGPISLTPAAARRIASDADLQMILHDDGEVLGVGAPTASIPARVRVGVQARDQGCRFPGCRMPVQHCDLHHVQAREDGGHTTVENLVALCRRHHTAVTNGWWRLSMDPDGTVQVRRGQRRATSDPPHRRGLPPPPRASGKRSVRGSQRSPRAPSLQLDAH